MSNSVHAQAVMLRMLHHSWPATVTIAPASLDLEGQDGVIDFLNAVQYLSDEGLLSYEALVVDPAGPRVLDAAITTRGRSHLTIADAGKAGEPVELHRVPQ